MTATRALYVLKRFPRLSETFIVREIAGLEQAGVEVLVDALLEPEDEPRHAETDCLRAPTRYLPRRPALTDPTVLWAHARAAVRRPVTWLALARAARAEGTWRRFLQAGIVADRARRSRVTNIHAHFATAAAEVAVPAGLLAGVPVTVTAHAKDIYERENAAHLARRLRRVSAVVTVSEYNRRHLQDLLPGTEVCLVPNGVAVQPNGEPAPDGPVLCIARLVEKKGIDVLLTALAELAATYPYLRLELVGAGPLDGELRARCERLDIADRVSFRGALSSEAVDEAYARAALVALPCRITANGDRDGLPTVLTEAAARGLPVVSTDIVGIRELVLDGRTGYLVAADDPGQLAVAMAKLIDQPTLARRLGAAGRDHVAANFSPGAATRNLLDLFEGVRCASR